MSMMRRRFLRLATIVAATVSIPQLAPARDAGTGVAFRLAMGPVSAPQKLGGPPTAPATTAATCAPSEGPCPKPHHHSKRRHTGAPAR
jgi:hypothetical protein